MNMRSNAKGALSDADASRNKPSLVLAAVAMAGVAWIGGCSSSGGSSGGSSGALTGTVERGKYLVDNLLVCGECHTPSGPDGKPDTTKYLGGSRNYEFPFTANGMAMTAYVYAENLTPDPKEGLGDPTNTKGDPFWTNANIRKALTEGIDDENVAMWPIMPYPEYSLLKTEDVDSIIQYLRTVPRSTNFVPTDDPPDFNAPAPQVMDSQIPHTTLAQSDPAYASAERGRYLAAVACVQCHTPAIEPGIPDFSKAFAGGRKYQVKVNSNATVATTFTSTNLTPDATGLAGWTIADIVQSIKHNTEKGTNRDLCITMPGGPGRMGDLADQDLTDIATYLANLAPIKNGPFSCTGP